MKVFFLDLWLDLKEKRLAPVAILLAIGIVAVLILVPNGSSETAAPPPATSTTAAAASTPVVAGSTTVTSSKLQTFSARDPFEPTSSAGTGTTTGSGGSTDTTATSTPTSTTGTSESGGGGTTTGTQPSTGTGTGTGTGTTGTGNTGNTTGETKQTLFTYTVDLRFGESGNVPKYSDVKRLDLLPDAENPKVVFLGVTATGKTAVFLVDSNIGVDTDGGRCKPSRNECTFLYLRPDADHDQAVLTDADGTVYRLRLLAIHRVSISSTTNSGSNGKGNGNSRSNAFTGSADQSSNDNTSVPGEAPPGEPDHSSNFQQFFADGSN